jgi:hypothetical protein
MKSFGSIADFVLHLDAIPAKLALVKARGLREGGEIIKAEIRAELGEYQNGDAGFEDWQELSPVTIADKAAEGFDVPSPLKRTGTMGESFKVHVEGDEAVVSSNDPVAVYQNEGTDAKGVRFIPGVSVEPGIPAREFVGRAAFRKTPEVVDAIAIPIVTALAGGIAPKGEY